MATSSGKSLWVELMLDILFTTQGKKFVLHLVPSGILNEGNGVVVHFPGLFKEIDGLEANGVSCKGKILISDHAHLLFDFHQEVDGLKGEGAYQIFYWDNEERRWTGVILARLSEMSKELMT